MQKSQGITELGAIKPSLALSTLAVFVLVYFALWKGVKSTGKVIMNAVKNVIFQLFQGCLGDCHSSLHHPFLSPD